MMYQHVVTYMYTHIELNTYLPHLSRDSQSGPQWDGRQFDNPDK